MVGRGGGWVEAFGLLGRSARGRGSGMGSARRLRRPDDEAALARFVSQIEQITAAEFSDWQTQMSARQGTPDLPLVDCAGVKTASALSERYRRHRKFAAGGVGDRVRRADKPRLKDIEEVSHAWVSRIRCSYRSGDKREERATVGEGSGPRTSDS